MTEKDPAQLFVDFCAQYFGLSDNDERFEFNAGTVLEVMRRHDLVNFAEGRGWYFTEEQHRRMKDPAWIDKELPVIWKAVKQEAVGIVETSHKAQSEH